MKLAWCLPRTIDAVQFTSDNLEEIQRWLPAGWEAEGVMLPGETRFDDDVAGLRLSNPMLRCVDCVGMSSGDWLTDELQVYNRDIVAICYNQSEAAQP